MFLGSKNVEISNWEEENLGIKKNIYKYGGIKNGNVLFWSVLCQIMDNSQGVYYLSCSDSL